MKNKCSMCGINVTYWNTQIQADRQKTVRCGKCYLKWRAEIRKSKGLS